MNKKDILKVINKIEKPIDNAVISILTCVALVAGHSSYLTNKIDNSEKINNENLEKVVKEEKEKLGLSNTPIKVEFFDKTKHKSFGTSYCTHDTSINDYLVVLEKNQERRGVLRHELYHIKKAHTEMPTYGHPIRNIFDEYSANMYSVHDLQLEK